MPTLIHPALARPTEAVAAAPSFRHPHYDCEDLPQALRITVYVPGVDSHGIEISSRGPDLVVTARKARHVRVNWQALHLESAQLDYRLKLRLGTTFDFDELRATLHEGVLVLTLPKQQSDATPVPVRPPLGRVGGPNRMEGRRVA